MAYYLDNGFVNVQVGAPKLDIQGGKAKVTYPVREGSRYQVRKVELDGDLVMPKEKLTEMLEVKPRTWYKRSLLAEDIKNLTKLYNNLGYAYADIEPLQNVNDKYNFLDIAYHINKGQRVSIERVDIQGNERTRDKVIRRMLNVSEGQLYNGDRIESSKERLEQTEYFEAVRIKTAPGSQPDKMRLTVEVMEKKTGSLAAGMGFSSQEGVQGNIHLRERNLLGLGIVANLKSSISGRRTTYEGSLTYPWFLDVPLAVSIRGHKVQSREQGYLRETDGFGFDFQHGVERGQASLGDGENRC